LEVKGRPLEKANVEDQSNILSVEAEYKFVSDITKYKSDLIHNTFDRFLKIFTAIVGGSIWLSLQKNVTSTNNDYYFLADTAAALLSIFSALIIADDFRSWFGYRERSSALGGESNGRLRIKRPTIWPAFIVPSLMITAITTSSVLFAIYNPLAEIEQRLDQSTLGAALIISLGTIGFVHLALDRERKKIDRELAAAREAATQLESSASTLGLT
jgi:hypothetical protein